MEDNYVNVKFKTTSGFKNIKIRKIGEKQQKQPPIRTGLIGTEGQSGMMPGFMPMMPGQGHGVLVGGGGALQPGTLETKIAGLKVVGSSYSGEDRIEIKVEGITLPDIPYDIEGLEAFDEEGIKNLNIKYPLIPRSPKQGEHVMSYAHIFYNTKLNEPVYLVYEPKIDEKDEKLLEEVKEYIREKLDINFFQLTRSDTIKYIIVLLEKAFDYFKVKERGVKRDVYKYYILRDFIGLGKIEPFMQDKQIEDISCDGVNIPIYVYHRDPKLGTLRTNVKFSSQDELDSFVNKLSERCGKTISVSRPLLDGSLPDGSRVQSTLGSDIARHGSNFTIRMFTEKPLTPVDMINFGTCDLKMMAYYWFLVENGFSILVSGGTASGKTSLLNVLSLFIKPQMKIVSIEDTAELRLPHAHWIPEVARTPIAEEGKVDMFELLRESLRQRPDYIIVGEVRGKEAYVLFQQMATGHPGLSTIHAENFQKLMDRLISPPISLPPSLIQNLDAILFVKRVKQGRRYVRKIFSSAEVLGYDSKNGVPLVNDVFKWDGSTDKFKITNKSGLMKKVTDTTGLSAANIQEEIRKRAAILEWLLNQKITDYRKVGSVINLFYMSPDFLLERIGVV